MIGVYPEEATEANRLHDALDQFAARMRAKLLANIHKGGWDAMRPVSILARVCEELEELMKTCTPSPGSALAIGNETLSAHLDHQREQMIVAVHHVRCAASVLQRLALAPTERVVSPKTAGEAADVANFCMFLSHQASERGEKR